MFNVLVVCTANICRSPAAEKFINRALSGRAAGVSSAGVQALAGISADATVQQQMIDRGYPEIAGHRSRLLLPSDIRKSQLLLCMERWHIDAILKADPIAVGKTMLLGHWSGVREVADPIGGSDLEYSTALTDIKELSVAWAERLVSCGLVE